MEVQHYAAVIAALDGVLHIVVKRFDASGLEIVESGHLRNAPAMGTVVVPVAFQGHPAATDHQHAQLPFPRCVKHVADVFHHVVHVSALHLGDQIAVSECGRFLRQAGDQANHCDFPILAHGDALAFQTPGDVF